MKLPEPPKPPLIRMIRENTGGVATMCPQCGSSMRFKWFWQKSKGCIQPECDNYEEA